MKTLSQKQFLNSMPDAVIPHLPSHLQGVHAVPWNWLVKFHFGEPRLHYEISRVPRRDGWELGFHFESKDKNLNRYLLQGFRRHLFEIKDTLEGSMEAEMWDRGWSKIYEVYPSASLTTNYQAEIGKRVAEIMICLHPIFIELRGAVTAVYR